MARPKTTNFKEIPPDDLVQRAFEDDRLFEELLGLDRQYLVDSFEKDWRNYPEHIEDAVGHAITSTVRKRLKIKTRAWQVVRSYATVAARRRLLRIIKKERQERARLELLALHIAEEPAAGDSTEKAELARKIREALASLKDEEREACVLRICEEWSTQEIADEFGILRGTVASRISRGLNKVRDILGREI